MLHIESLVWLSYFDGRLWFDKFFHNFMTFWHLTLILKQKIMKTKNKERQKHPLCVSFLVALHWGDWLKFYCQNPWLFSALSLLRTSILNHAWLTHYSCMRNNLSLCLSVCICSLSLSQHTHRLSFPFHFLSLYFSNFYLSF